MNDNAAPGAESDHDDAMAALDGQGNTDAPRIHLTWETMKHVFPNAVDDPDLQRIVGDLQSHWNTRLTPGDSRAFWTWASQTLLRRLRSQPAAPDATPRIAFVVDGDYPSAWNLLPLVQELDSRGIPTLVLMLEYYHRRRRPEFGALKFCRTLSVDSILAGLSVAELIREAKRSRGAWRALVGRMRPGIIGDSIARHPNYARTTLAQQSMLELAISRFLEAHDVRAVVALAFTNGVPRAAQAACRPRRIPTVLPPHGAMHIDLGDFVPPFQPDEILSWGPFWDYLFEQATRLGARVHHVGYPPYDGMAAAVKNPELANLVGRMGDGPKVLLAPDVLPLQGRNRPAGITHHRRVATQLGPLAKDRSLILKIHPGFRVSDGFYRDAYPPDFVSQCLVVHSEFRLAEILPFVDVAVCGVTSAIVEAMAIDVPVVLTGTVETEVPPFLDQMGCIIPSSPDELPVLVDRVRRPGDLRQRTLAAQRRFLSQALVNFGRARKASADVLERLWSGSVEPSPAPTVAPTPRVS